MVQFFALIEFAFADELDQLAASIGKVMQKASNQVDSNMDEMKSTYSEKLSRLDNLLKKVCGTAYDSADFNGNLTIKFSP